MAIKLVTLLPTEFSAKLELGDEDDLRVVYRPSERNPDFYIYHDLWYPEEDYPDGYIAVPLGSVYVKNQTFNEGDEFVNVKGSTYDPKPNDPKSGSPYTSWRQLMKAKIPNYNTCCAETDIIYNSETGKRDFNFHCTNGGNEAPDPDYEKGIWMQGAHVLMGETSSKMPTEGATVYMLPLCKNHNIYSSITGSYGTGYYMKLRRRQEVIVLAGFIPSDTVHNAIIKEELEMNDVLQTTEKPQLSVGLEFKFMDVELGAYYTKKDKGYRIFVAPMNVDNNKAISLSEMIKQFNQLAGAGSLSEGEVKSKIESEKPNGSGLDWNSIKFCLKMLFLDIDREEEKNTTEYALSLQIIAEGLIPDDITVFNFKSLSFNIWNTNNRKVLDKMALTTPETFE